MGKLTTVEGTSSVGERKSCPSRKNRAGQTDTMQNLEQPNRRNFMKMLGFGASALSTAGCASRQTKRCEASQSRPNVVFIYTDDQAPWALGASGNPQAFTPNMDRLVREGAYLTNSFTTTPVCSPSRVSLITSRYGSENGILDFIPQIGHKLYKPGLGIAPDATTFPKILSQAGYVTGLIGKWHLGQMDEVHPTRMGYDEFMGFRGGGISPVDPILEEDGVEREFKGLTCDILTDRALGFLQRHQSDPFMLSVHYRAPHKKWLPVSEEDWAPYETMQAELPNPDYPDLDIPKMEQWMREYLASVSGVDRNLGRILDTLDDLNLSENTVVIFSSDHGYNMGHNGIWHKGNGMWATLESTWKVPPQPVRQLPARANHGALARCDRTGDSRAADDVEPGLVPHDPGDVWRQRSEKYGDSRKEHRPPAPRRNHRLGQRSLRGI